MMSMAVALMRYLYMMSNIMMAYEVNSCDIFEAHSTYHVRDIMMVIY